MLRIVSLLCCLLLSRCQGFVHDEVLVARYRIIAVDILEDMSLCWSMDSGNCAGYDAPGPTLFAAGFNDKYVVVAIHPRLNFDQSPNKEITEFFYITRDLQHENSDSGMPHNAIMGPLNESEFKAERAKLALPEFTRVFHNLK